MATIAGYGSLTGPSGTTHASTDPIYSDVLDVPPNASGVTAWCRDSIGGTLTPCYLPPGWSSVSGDAVPLDGTSADDDYRVTVSASSKLSRASVAHGFIEHQRDRGRRGVAVIGEAVDDPVPRKIQPLADRGDDPVLACHVVGGGQHVPERRTPKDHLRAVRIDDAEGDVAAATGDQRVRVRTLRARDVGVEPRADPVLVDPLHGVRP